MKKLKEAFLEMNTVDKIAFIVGQAASLTVIISAILQIAGVWDAALTLCQICMGISLTAQAVMQWKKNRGIAILSLGVAVFVFSVAGVILFLK